MIQICGEETNIKIKKYQLISLILVVGAVGLAAIALQPSKIALNGVLRNNDDTLVKDGYYDMRVVAVDAAGQPLLTQDFSDVTVKDGGYALPITIPRFADTGSAVFQICRSEQPTDKSDGLSQDIPDGCKKPVEEQKTFSLAECPQTVTILDAGGISTVIGKRTATVGTDGCTTTITSELITTENTGKSSIVAINGKDGTDGSDGAAGTQGPAGPKGDKGDKGDSGEQGQNGADGQSGSNGAPGTPGETGPQGPAGDPATDDQTLAYVAGTQVLSIAGGNSVSLSSLLDNTDVLASLSCGVGQVAQWNGSVWICASAAVDTDDQTLSLASNTLSIDNGNSVSLAGYLDNTDAQAISLAGNVLSISGNATTVNLSAYLDNTDVLASLSCGLNQIAKWNGSTWACAADGDTTYSSGTGISIVGTVISAALGTDIVSGEIVDGTIATADIAANAITSSLINDGTIVNTDIADGTIANVKLANSAVTITAGTGLAGGGTVALGGSITLTNSLGTAIDNSEITDGTILFADIAANGCNSGEIMEYNGSAWSCGIDGGITAEVDGSTTNELQNIFQTISAPSGTNSIADGTTDTLAFANGSGVSITSDGTTDTITIAATLGTSIDSSEIVDGTVSNTDLANSSVTVTAGTGLSGGGAVSLGGSVSLNTTLGTSIDTSEIVDGTIVLADFSDFGCGLNQIIKYNGSAWACAADAGLTAEVDGSTTNELQNIFQTIATPDANDPSADSTTDTLTLANGSGVSITSNGTTDTITIAATLGTSIDSSEITDGTITSSDISGSAGITNGQLANSSVTVTAGTGLTGGGSLSLGGTVTLHSALGTSVDSSEIVDGTVVSNDIFDGTITSSDLAAATILFSNIAQNGCSSNQIMKWNGSAWACAADATGSSINSFETIATSTGTSPVADSATDTLTLTGGSGVTITGDGTTDTITIAATLGTDITSAEIVDGTIVSADISDGSVSNSDLANSSVTVTAGTGLTGGGTVSLGGTITLHSALGTSVDSAEIVDGTIATADIVADAITSALISDGTIVNLDIADGTIANVKLANSAVTVTAGTGLSGGGTVALGGSVSLTSSLGTAIDTSEISDGTILFADVAANGCNSGEIMEYNGSAWSCGIDGGITAEVDGSTTNEIQNLFETISAPAGTNAVADSSTDTLAFANGSGISITADGTTDTITVAATLGVSIDSSEIVDGTVSNTDLANNSVTVTAGTGLSGGGAVSLGGSVTLNSSLGTSVDTSELVDGTIVLADFSDFGCGLNQIIKYNGSAWACAADAGLTAEVDGSTTNELQNIFLTIATPDANDPTADSTTDTLTLANGSGISITSNGTTDTITIATTLGTSVDSSEISDGTITSTDISGSAGITNGQLANSAVTVTAGTGLTGGGSVSLGGTVTLNSALGTSVDSSEIVDGTIIDSDIAADAITSALIADGTIVGGDIADSTIANAKLTNSAVTVTAGTGLSGGGTVALGGTISLTSALGTSIDTSEITDGTILFADIAANGCNSGEIMEYNGSAWICGTDSGITSEVDGSTTNEIQNLFETISAPGGTNSVADSSTDTLAFANGSGISITSDGTTDTITIAATLGVSIDSSEIVDGTVSNTDLANSSVTVTAGTGLSGGGAVSLGGSVSLSSSLGTAIDTSELVDGTIVLADFSDFGCGLNQIIKYNGSAWACAADAGLTAEVDGSTTNELQNIFLTIDAPNGTDPTADSTTDTLALADGSGITITGDSTTDTITIASVLGTAIDSSEITDGTILFSDVGSNSCGTNDIFKFNGSAWYCGTDVDTDTTLSEASVEALIFDGDNTGTISSGTLALGSLSYTGTLSDTNISDALTISSSGSVADGALSSNVSLFGSSVDSSEITNGTVTGTDLASATILFSNIAQNGCGSDDIMKWNGSAWACAVDEVNDADASATNELQNLFATVNTDNGTDPVADGTTDTLNLVSGTGVTVTGDGTTDTITIAATLGTDITSAEIVDGTIVSGDIADGTITGTDVSDGTIANGDLANSSVTITAGSGLTTGGSVSLGGSVTLDIGAGSGITVNANDITLDLTTATDALSSTTSSSSGLEVLGSGLALIQGCSDGQLLKWSEASDVWSCANDTDTTLSEATVESYIFDGDNAGTLASGTLALGSLSYTGTLTDTNVADTLTIGASSTIADGALSANVSLLGSAIESSEITDLTIVGGDIADDTIALTSKTTGNYVATITNGSGISGSSSSEGGTPTIALGPLTSDWNQTGAFDISLNNASSELKILESAGATYFGIFDVGDLSGDRTYTFPDVSGAVSILGQTIESGEITDGTIANGDLANSSVTITAGSGLTTGGSVSLGGSVTLDIGAGTGITVNANDIAITADGINFTELSDTLSLDATTTISLGGNNLTTNLNGTGDYAIQFGGNTVFQILETGAVTIGSILSDQTIGVDNGTGTINIATDSDANTTNIGTGTSADTVTIGDSNANVALTDAQWSISGAGAANFASVTGAGLSDCDQSDDTLKWDSTSGQFSCGTNRGTFHNVMNGNYTNNNTGFTDVDADADGTDDIGFTVGANETWVFDASLQLQSNATADAKFDVTAPAGSTCDISVANIENSLSVSNLACGASTGLVPIADANYNEINVRGVVATGATTGSAMVQFGQNTASGTSTIAAGSFITAYRISGADYAEIYYAEDQLQKGMIAQMTGAGPSQVRRSTVPYSDKLLGIYSTSPGKVLAEADGSGTPVPIALTGRVPIKLSTENGLPKAGDMITASGTLPGYGMLANRSGYIVGQMMVDAVDNGDGTAAGFVFVRHGYWQSPISVDLTSIFGSSATAINQQAGGNSTAEVDGVSVLGGDSNYLSQDVINSILSGFTIQQGQITELASKVDSLEQSGILASSLFSEYLAQEKGSLAYLTDVRFTKNVSFEGAVTFNTNQAGTVAVPAGVTQVSVTFEPTLAGIPKIIASPNSFIEGAWKVRDITQTGFVLELNSAQSEDAEFTWQSVLTQ